ncbi:MAG: tetratricopeptide repeat protein [Caldilinea sp. CFX5]|nr:tetratricopeptide repeat protein [Caldilinea sp. CFX5]
MNANKSQRPPLRKRTTPSGEDISDYVLQRKRGELVSLPFHPATENKRGKLLVDLAGLYWKRGDFAPALDVWQQLLKMAEAEKNAEFQAKIHSVLALTQAHNGAPAKAVEHAQRALIFDPHSKEALFAMGLACDYNGDYAKAIEWLQRLQTQEPELSHVSLAMGSIYLRWGKFPEAEQHLRQALALEPEDDVALNELGNFYVSVGRYQEAQELFKKAMRLDPKMSSAYNNLGNCYLRMGRLDDARRLYEKRVQVRPEDALWACIGLGILYRTFSGDKALAQSKRWFEQALTIYATKEARLLTGRLVEHDVRRALILTGLDDPEGLAVWSTMMTNAELQYVGRGVWDDWLFSLRLLADCHRPPAQVSAIIPLVAEQFQRYYPQNAETT